MTRFLKKINPVCWSIPSDLFLWKCLQINCMGPYWYSLQCCHNERYGVSNHQRLYCLLNRFFRCKSNKTSKFRVTGLCAGNSPVRGKFPAERASNAENVSIWWRHYEVDIGSVNGLMPSGKQPISWTNIDPNLYRHMTSLGQNAFNRYVQIVVCYSWYWYLHDGIYIYLYMTIWHKSFDELLLKLEMTVIRQYWFR